MGKSRRAPLASCAQLAAMLLSRCTGAGAERRTDSLASGSSLCVTTSPRQSCLELSMFVYALAPEPHHHHRHSAPARRAPLRLFVIVKVRKPVTVNITDAHTPTRAHVAHALKFWQSFYTRLRHVHRLGSPSRQIASSPIEPRRARPTHHRCSFSCSHRLLLML
jgi:hypothetical protein